jgi:glutathione synthase/RimK-type ligase-like ATP-grasp enzyme
MEIAFATPKQMARSGKLWLELLSEDGFTVTLIHHPEQVKRHWPLTFFYGNRDAPSTQLNDALEAAHVLEEAGSWRMNCERAWQLAADKWLSAQAFKAAAVPHPETHLASAESKELSGPHIIKPRWGGRGQGITIESNPLLNECTHPKMIAQPLLPGKTLRIVASSSRGLFAYFKESGDLVASVSQGAERKWVEPIPSSWQDLAVGAVRALEGDMMGVDLLVDEDQALVLEANAGFAIYREDKAQQHLLLEEYHELINKKRR